MKSLLPQIKAIKEQFVGDQERIHLETSRLYKLAGINPLAVRLCSHCIVLYRALSNIADEGFLTEGFSGFLLLLDLLLLLLDRVVVESHGCSLSPRDTHISISYLTSIARLLSVALHSDYAAHTVAGLGFSKSKKQRDIKKKKKKRGRKLK